MYVVPDKEMLVVVTKLDVDSLYTITEPSIRVEESTSVKFFNNVAPGVNTLVTTIVSPSCIVAEVLLSGKTLADIVAIN